VDWLRKSGVEVACFGHGWPTGSIPAEEIPKIIRSSVISLNFANSRGQNQIKARTFEVPGGGGFLLTEAAPGLDLFYRPGVEIATFKNRADLLSKIRHYLAHPQERNAVALSGFERTRREHTYESRFQEVLDFAVRSREAAAGTGKRIEKRDKSVILARHRSTLPLQLFRTALLLPCTAIWKKERGTRAARRLVFELSWRLMGRRTFAASGWPARMFPEI
jgi:spore maturation protein CgeB